MSDMAARPESSQIRMVWTIHMDCNYRCPYCWFCGQWDKLKAANRYPGNGRLLKIWASLRERYGEIVLSIIGGEPFTYPDFAELAAELSKLHMLRLSTNMSGDIETFAEKAQARRVYLGMSFHPLQTSFESFLQKAEMVKRFGLDSNVNFVAWPPFIKDVARYAEAFASRGLRFEVLPFWGNHEGKEYPAAYTKDEREVLAPYVRDIGMADGKSRLAARSTFGLSCRAGQKSASISPDGSVYRCGGDGWRRDQRPFANLFDGELELLRSPAPCPAQTCPCSEWADLLV